METNIAVITTILIDKTMGNFSGCAIEASIGKINPIPSNDVTATPINIVQLLELKLAILGPIPSRYIFHPENQKMMSNPITINADEINDTSDNFVKFLIHTKGIINKHWTITAFARVNQLGCSVKSPPMNAIIFSDVNSTYVATNPI